MFHRFSIDFPHFPGFPQVPRQFCQGLALHKAHTGALRTGPQGAGALLGAHAQKLRDALGSSDDPMGKIMEKLVGKMGETWDNSVEKWRNMRKNGGKIGEKLGKHRGKLVLKMGKDGD